MDTRDDCVVNGPETYVTVARILIGTGAAEFVWTGTRDVARQVVFAQTGGMLRHTDGRWVEKKDSLYFGIRRNGFISGGSPMTAGFIQEFFKTSSSDEADALAELFNGVWREWAAMKRIGVDVNVADLMAHSPEARPAPDAFTLTLPE